MKKRANLSLVVISITLSLGGVLAATSIAISPVELGAGSASTPTCLQDSVIDFGTSQQGNLTGITISQIGSDCAGQWVRLSLYSSSDGTGLPIEQIVWQVPAASTPPVTAYTLRANGVTTETTLPTVWPSSEAGSSGLASPTIATSNVNSYLLEVSDTALTDGP